MATKARRLWCACAIIDYLAGTARGEPCRDIIKQIEREVGQHEILVSMWAEAEVVKFDGVADDEAEKRIKEFFGRDYVVRVALDLVVAEKVRYLVRRYGIKPQDATHMATALVHEVPVLETYDDDLLKLDGKEGTPLLVIREPLYEGPPPSVPGPEQLALGPPPA